MTAKPSLGCRNSASSLRRTGLSPTEAPWGDGDILAGFIGVTDAPFKFCPTYQFDAAAARTSPLSSGYAVDVRGGKQDEKD